MSFLSTLFVNRDQQVSELQQWPATKRAHQSLWNAHNSYVEGDYDAETSAKLAPVLAQIRTALTLGDTAMKNADAGISEAITKAITDGKLTAADVAQTGLGNPALALGAALAIIAAYLAIPVITYMLGLKDADAEARTKLAAVQQIIALSNAGKPIPPELTKVATGTSGNSGATAAAISGVGMLAIGVGLLLFLGKGKP